MVGALRYKPEGRGLDSRGLNHSRLRYVLGVDSASKRYDCQEYILGGKGGRCVGLKISPASRADYLEIMEASTSCSLKGLSRLAKGWLKKSIIIVHKYNLNQ